MLDTHCHLLDSDQPYSFYRPVNPHLILSMSVASNQWFSNQQLSHSYAEVFYAVGVHPWFISSNALQDLQNLPSFLKDSKCLAIGEIGLDFSPKHKHSRELQLQIFIQQCSLALEYNRPVSIHAVKSHSEVLRVLKQMPIHGVIHGISASMPICHEYVRLGFKLGVNCSLLNPAAKRVREMVCQMPLDALVLETDFPNACSTLTLDALIQEISLLTGRSISEVIEKTNYNAQQIFDFPEV